MCYSYSAVDFSCFSVRLRFGSHRLWCINLRLWFIVCELELETAFIVLSDSSDSINPGYMFPVTVCVCVCEFDALRIIFMAAHGARHSCCGFIIYNYNNNNNFISFYSTIIYTIVRVCVPVRVCVRVCVNNLIILCLLSSQLMKNRAKNIAKRRATAAATAVAIAICAAAAHAHTLAHSLAHRHPLSALQFNIQHKNCFGVILI